MKTHEREIMVYYNPDSRSDRSTVAYAKTMSVHVKTYAYGQTPSTELSWRRIVQALNKNPKELLNKSHPYYRLHIKGREFDEESWVKILRRNPDLMRSPIALSGKRVVVCDTPTDIYRLLEK